MPPVHDYVIDNSTGANVRADINNVLQAILTNNSSSSAPSTTAAYMWWADTTNGVLKIRNSSNNDWVELLQLDGTLTLEDGSASTPGLAFRDDLNTGIFSSAADTFNIATAGVERMELGATTIFNEDGADIDFRIESDTKTHMFFIDSGNNRIGINSSSPTAMFQIVDTASGGDGVIEMFRLQGSGNSNADGQQLSFARSGVGITAAIQAVKNETAANETDIRFSNMTAGSLTEKARIDGNGRLLLGTTTASTVTSTDDLTIATSGSTGIELRSGTGNAGNLTFADGTSGDDRQRGIIQYHHSDDSMRLFTNASERMRIDSSGHVGIGVTPDNTFSFGKALDIGSSTGSFIYVRDTDQAAAVGGIGYSGTDTYISNKAAGNIRFLCNTDATERMRINSSGQVLIGQTSVSSTEASGKFCVSAAISGGGQGVITANDTSSNDFGCGLVVNKNSSTTTSGQRFVQFYANNFAQPMGGIGGNGTENAQFITLSDERYKKNIKPLSGILEKVNKLKTISFDWKHKNESVKAGFIAQNVKEIFPEYVVDNIGNDESNKKMGTTGGMSAGYIAILTAAIQELSAKVAALEAA